MNMTVSVGRMVVSRFGVVSLVVIGLAAGVCGARSQIADDQAAASVMQTPLEKSRAAIEECRQKRLRGELATYKESAECSSPKIFAAWQEAHYPHMDLIVAWLNAREEASGRVDQKVITPQEFERQMDELTIRLTAEEQRRRAGLARSVDGQLELQLPPASQVVAVVPPAKQDKTASKKTEAAKVRAASNSQSPDLTSGQGRPSVSALTTVDGSQTPAGVGGPFVPVNPNSPAARAVMARAAATAAPGEGSNGFYIQLASQRSETDARATYRLFQGQYPSVLGSRDAVIRRVDDSSQGAYYRVEVGPLSSGQADELCNSLKASGRQCVTRYE
jgi:hypothetical protein